jgi:hypothetical protein
MAITSSAGLGGSIPQMNRGVEVPGSKALFHSVRDIALIIDKTVQSGYGVLRAGTILAKNATTNLLVPYVTSDYTDDNVGRAFITNDISNTDDTCYVTKPDSYKFQVGDPLMLVRANAETDATATAGASVTTSGTVVGSITVNNDGGVTTETWTVVFSTATAAAVYGSVSGHVGDWADYTAGAFAPDNGGNPYFSLPQDFFGGTWTADETFTFSTTEYVAGTSAYASAHSGSIGLGSISAPEYIRMEAVYTYPNGTNHMYIVFPRANVVSSVEINMQTEDNANVPITYEAKRADSEVSGGNAVWDTMPLGRIYFD